MPRFRRRLPYRIRNETDQQLTCIHSHNMRGTKLLVQGNGNLLLRYWLVYLWSLIVQHGLSYQIDPESNRFVGINLGYIALLVSRRLSDQLTLEVTYSTVTVKVSNCSSDFAGQ